MRRSAAQESSPPKGDLFFMPIFSVAHRLLRRTPLRPSLMMPSTFYHCLKLSVPKCSTVPLITQVLNLCDKIADERKRNE
ncbi:MAG: hypothetical protein ACK4I8_03060 [Armatimonadota bacterium]